MEITKDREGDVVILRLSGKLDAATSKAFEDRILADIAAGGQRFVIDLAHLEYVSSSGLRVFLLAAKRLNGAKGKIVLCGLKDHIRQVFDLAGFSSILAIYNARDEALKNL